MIKRSSQSSLFTSTSTAVFALLMVSTSAMSTLYVIPSSQCAENSTNESCLTLSKVANNTARYFSDNTTLILKPGDHILDLQLIVADTSQLEISVMSNSTVTRLTCSESSSLTLQNVSNLSIKGIVFSGCANIQIAFVGQFTLKNCSFYGQELSKLVLQIPSSMSYAGLYLNSVSSATFERCSFSFFNNGGALKIFSCKNLTISDSLLQHNVAVNGSAVYAIDTDIKFNGVVFHDNTAINDGAAIYTVNTANNTNNLQVINSLFTNHTAFSGVTGGAIVAQIKGDVMILDSRFENNRAYESEFGGGVGGAMAVWYSTNVVIENTTFMYNRAYYAGGSVFASDSKVTITNNTFNSNIAGNHYETVGGAVYTEYCNLTIDNCIFIDNAVIGVSDIRLGGALDAYSCNELFILNSLFQHNEAAYGTSVSAIDTNIVVDGVTFWNNSASIAGAAIYTSKTRFSSSNNNLHVINSLFKHNTVKNGYAGGVVVTRIQGDVMILDSRFESNRAEGTFSQSGTGVTLSVFNSSNTVIEHTSFINNRVSFVAVSRYDTASIGRVAIVYIAHSNLTIDDSTFTNNSAVGEHPVGSGFLSSGMYTYGSTISMQDCTFEGNTADGIVLGGSALRVLYSANAVIENTTFTSNRAINYGGSMYTKTSNVAIKNSTFEHNAGIGGAINIVDCNLTIDNSMFFDNTIVDTDDRSGGAIWLTNSRVEITTCTFAENTALGVFGVGGGGAIALRHGGVLIINDSTFSDNRADIGHGGAIYARDSSPQDVGIAVIQNCRFVRNVAHFDGGAISASMCDVNLSNTLFVNNVAIGNGEALYVESNHFITDGFLNMEMNHGGVGVVYASQSDLFVSGDVTISNNCGSFLALDSNVTFQGNTYFMDNGGQRCSNETVDEIQQGGAVTAFQSIITFEGTANLIGNQADNGGALLLVESDLYMHGDITISNNSAQLSGGGIYAYQSELDFMGSNSITDNTADNEGGGMHAIGSTTRLLEGDLHFSRNFARRGGGMFLESNAKLYIIKPRRETRDYLSSREDWLSINFIQNSADYGAAVYVSDDTNSGTCASTPSSVQSTAVNECFLQTFRYHLLQNLGRGTDIAYQYNFKNVYFSKNLATFLGDSLYGGLLDRCTVSPLAEVLRLEMRSGVAYNVRHKVYSNKTNGLIYDITDIQKDDVASDPVHVCFCNGDQPDCSYQPDTMMVRKGEMFNLSLVAVDQVGRPISSMIHSSLRLQGGTFSEGQLLQNASETCTELEYNILSPHDSEQVLLYAEGPCRDIGISQRSINVTFLPCDCPIGFQPSSSQIDCQCDCDSTLKPFITNCSVETKAVIRQGDLWITYYVETSSNSSTEGYVIHPNCPYDYCYPPSDSVFVNLNDRNGSDAQCAFNHSGVLCGSCKEGLSLSLGSSQCMSCSNHWLTLLIPFAIAGIALVAFLLVFNLTVAVGTINGLIFYANVIIANRTLFFPFEGTNFPTLFVAWLNLDFGFETCFYNGMDGYAKVWLQLAFPLYIIFLVAMVIIVSDYIIIKENSWWITKTLHRLLSNTNPVATLATLILLSYAKLLRTIIAALSFTTLEYPDGSRKSAWLYDANISYLEGKHIPLFIAALLILLVGVVYTFVLLFWQWVIKCNCSIINKKFGDRNGLIAKIASGHSRTYTGLNNFMDTYHAPYVPTHRYWTGLLLLARGVLYLITSVNITGDPSVNLLTTICVVGGLLLWKSITKKVTYKNWLLNAVESSFIFNLLIFSAATLYLELIRDAGGNQAALAYTSTSIAFITFIGILLYHLPWAIYTIVKVLDHKRSQNYKEFIKARRESTHIFLQNVRSKRITNKNTAGDTIANPITVAKRNGGINHEPPRKEVSCTSMNGLPDKGGR